VSTCEINSTSNKCVPVCVCLYRHITVAILSAVLNVTLCEPYLFLFGMSSFESHTVPFISKSP